MTILETNRLLLRHVIAGDAEPLAALWSDPDVMRYMGGPRDREKVRSLVEQDACATEYPDIALWTLVERSSGEVVGDCGLLRKEVDGADEIEICYIIARPFWRRGYATEIAAALRDHAARTLNAPRLIALIDPGNVASEIVAQRIGMRLERETIRPSGKQMRVYVWEKEAQ